MSSRPVPQAVVFHLDAEIRAIDRWCEGLVAARARGLSTVAVGPEPVVRPLVEGEGLGVLVGRPHATDLSLTQPGEWTSVLRGLGWTERGCAVVTTSEAAGKAAEAAGLSAVILEEDSSSLAVGAALDRWCPPTVVRDGGLALRYGWRTDETGGHDPRGVVALGSNTMTGNGYLGYRGTFPEWRAEAYAACVVSDTYDNADGKWTELVNIPDALRAHWHTGGRSLDLDPARPSDRVDRGLAIRYGMTELGVTTPAGVVRTERFASLDQLHSVHQRQTMVPAADGEVVVETGIDGQVWSLNGDHFATYDAGGEAGGLLTTTVTTPERGTTIAVAQAASIAGARVLRETIVTGTRQVSRHLRLQVQGGCPVVLHTVMGVTSSNDGPDPQERAAGVAREGREGGWLRALVRHAGAWEEVWRRTDVRIDGDELAQVSVRFGIYHNVIATPRHSERLPVGARGLSCQAYQGAAFWDQEVFNLPMFLHSEPRVARNLLAYRIHTLDGARRKAARLGYDGAFYAWISGDTGQELCPDFFFVDVLTGRPIRNHFNDWQIHISPDLVTALDWYVAATGDASILDDGGAELIVEVARFIASFVHFRPADGRYHCLRLLGADEYHENVDDNALTNYQVQVALQVAVTLPEPYLRAAGVGDDERRLWQDVVDRLYLPRPDPDHGVVEQFTGYFDLEDTTPDVVATRLQDPAEYWGWPNGVAVHTQVIKQADVVQLFVMQPDRFDAATMAASYDYYLPRTQHGSSLSPSAYAIVGAWLGRVDQAYELFLQGATVDLLSLESKTSGGTFIGGIRTAAAAGSWLMVTKGFAGLMVSDGVVRLSPRLPDRWSRLAFGVQAWGQQLWIAATHAAVTVAAPPHNATAVAVSVRGIDAAVEPGTAREWPG